MRAAIIAVGFLMLASAGRFSAAADQPAVSDRDLSQSASVEVSRTHQTWLGEAEAHLKAHRFAEAIPRLQKLLDAEPEFVPHPHGYENSHAAARRLLETLPAAWLDRYEELFGGIARAKLRMAQRQNDLAAIRRIASQYPLTQAGFEALRLSTVWLFDHGEHLAAAAGFQAISEHPFITRTNGRPMLAVDVLRWLQALSQVGLSEETQRVAKLYPNQWNNFRGKFSFANETVDERNQAAHSITPSSQVLWQSDFIVPVPAEKRIRSMHQELTSRGFSPFESFSPVIVGDVVISRSFDEVKACDLGTGVVLWRKSTKSRTVQLTYEGLMNNPQFREMISWQLAKLTFANPLQGSVTSDGRRVYLILTDQANHGVTTISRWGFNKNFVEDWNNRRFAFCQLLALDITTGKELWRVPATLPRREPAAPMSGWIRDSQPDVFFFGPPLPLGESLYVIGQKDREIRLYQLAAESGKIEWSLPLAAAERPLMKDPLRCRQACPIVASQGLLLCPTGAGALVAVDPLSRSRRWIYRYAREDLPKLLPGAWPAGDDDVHAGEDRWWSTWREVDLIVQTNAGLLVSPESDRLHAVSLRTGQPLWNQPRGDGQFLADAGNGQAVVVGSKSLRVFELDDGEISWSLPIPAPAGRGAFSSGRDGSAYLLPLQAGGVLKINPAQKTARRTFPLDSQPWGNLAVKGDAIVAETHQRLLRLAPLKLAPNPPADPKAKLAWAKSQREAGRFREAVSVLRDLKNDMPEAAEEQRETLLMELTVHPERVKAVAQDLEPLLDTAEPRIRGWRALAEAEKLSGHARASLEYWLKLLEENPTGQITSREDPTLEVEFSRYFQGAIFDLLDSAEPALKQQLEARLDEYREKTLSRRDPFAASRFARWFDQLKWGQELIVEDHHRTGIGQTALEQQLELWALTEAEGDQAVQALAFRRLAEDRLAEFRYREAAFFLGQLGEHFPDVKFPDGQSVAAFLEALPADSPARKADFGQSPRPAGKLRISSERRTVSLPSVVSVPVEAKPGSLCAELDLWLDPERRRLQFSGGGHSGFWELALPDERSPWFDGSFLKGWGVGPALVLQHGTDLLGIAPLDDHGEPRPRVLWQVRMLESDHEHNPFSENLEYRQHRPPLGFGVPYAELLDRFQQGVAQVGPVSAGILIYQSHGRLVAIETATGRKLWSRSRLPSETTIAGDSQHVLLIERHIPRVTVLRMLDGRAVITRDLPAAGRPLMWWKGRALFQEESPNDVMFSLWDPLTNRVLWKREAPAKSLAFQVDSRQWGFITPTGELTLFETESGQPLATSKLSGVQSPGQIHGMADKTGIYLAISHAKTPPADAHESPIVDDLPLRHPILAGTLHGLDRQTGKPLWHSSWGPWAFPLEQPATGPVLVLHHREKSGDNARAVVRCLEKRTGKQIFYIESDELREPPRWSGDSRQGEFELKAYKYTAKFRYER